MADTQWLTQAQYDLLASELKERVEVKRVEIARLIDAARQEGDLRENGGYHAARNEQSMNETRIQALQEMLEHAEVGETPADDGIVEPGMVVTAIVAGREQTFLLGSRAAGGDLAERGQLAVLFNAPRLHHAFFDLTGGIQRFAIARHG